MATVTLTEHELRDVIHALDERKRELFRALKYDAPKGTEEADIIRREHDRIIAVREKVVNAQR